MPPFPGAYRKVLMAWRDMKTRCLNPNARQYKHYGGRGITIAEEWLVFETFFRDMGYPFVGATLERRENILGYSKANCYWADKHDQSRNTRGRTLSVDSGISRDPATGEYVAKSSVIIIYRGLSLEEAKQERRKWVELNKNWKLS